MLIKYLIILNKSESWCNLLRLKLDIATKNRGKSKGSSRARKIDAISVLDNNQAKKKPPKYNIDISSFADIINKHPIKETSILD